MKLLPLLLSLPVTAFCSTYVDSYSWGDALTGYSQDVDVDSDGSFDVNIVWSYTTPSGIYSTGGGNQYILNAGGALSFSAATVSSFTMLGTSSVFSIDGVTSEITGFSRRASTEGVNSTLVVNGETFSSDAATWAGITLSAPVTSLDITSVTGGGSRVAGIQNRFSVSYTAVPEPSAAALLGLAGLALVSRRRR